MVAPSLLCKRFRLRFHLPFDLPETGRAGIFRVPWPSPPSRSFAHMRDMLPGMPVVSQRTQLRSLMPPA
jgi:hypothetical protein